MNLLLQSPGRFMWSIDELALIDPVEINSEDIHRQAFYLSQTRWGRAVGWLQALRGLPLDAPHSPFLPVGWLQALEGVLSGCTSLIPSFLPVFHRIDREVEERRQRAIEEVTTISILGSSQLVAVGGVGKLQPFNGMLPGKLSLPVVTFKVTSIP